MAADEATRATLMTELLQRVEALGLQQSIFPSQNETIDNIVRRLENVNPSDRPLSTNHLSSLVGNWQLIYASRGTVVTHR